ncbi:MAG: sigma-70 family RNA polymerase sigma factor [Solitalea sp.]
MRRPVPRSDDEVNSLFREGPADSFLMVYDRYAPKLLQYAASRLRNMDDAADLVHDVFMKAWLTRDRVREIKPYLYTLLRHRLIDHVRKNVSRQEYLEILRTLSSGQVVYLEPELHARDARQFISRALVQLPPRTREIFRLRRFDHLSIRQIALHLNISEQTVKNQLSNAHNWLRKSMAGLQLLALYFLSG